MSLPSQELAQASHWSTPHRTQEVGVRVPLAPSREALHSAAFGISPIATSRDGRGQWCPLGALAFTRERQPERTSRSRRGIRQPGRRPRSRRAAGVWASSTQRRPPRPAAAAHEAVRPGYPDRSRMGRHGPSPGRLRTPSRSGGGPFPRPWSFDSWRAAVGLRRPERAGQRTLHAGRLPRPRCGPASGQCCG